ncbi:MAG TPA: hypothetical protein PLV92_07140 [Pirellulaceae bacterium]|nr:hypothetical protein [Pirellulaceae bacterium]
MGCVVASLVLAAYFAWRPRTPGSVEELVEQAGGWQSRLSSTWEASSDSRPSDHPLDARVKAAAPRWPRLTTAYDAHAVVYELRRGVGRALLFVVRCPTDFLDDSRRLQRLPTTGSQAVGAWRRGPWLYLLSVDETNQRLEDYFSPVPTTVARRGPTKSPESRQLVALCSPAGTFHRHDSYFQCNRTENDF